MPLYGVELPDREVVSFCFQVCEMATDISESSGADTKNSAKLDADYPLRVLYCGVCSLPTEYCEYMPDVAKCRQWLEKNFPNEFAKLTVENSPKQETGISEGQGPVGEEEEKKKQKRGKAKPTFDFCKHPFPS